MEGMERIEPASRVWTRPDLPGVTFLRAELGRHAFPPHRHDTYVFGVSERGSYGTWRRRREHALDESHIAVVEPGEIHTARGPSHGPWIWRAVYVHPSALLPDEKASVLHRLARPALRDGKTAGDFLRLHRRAEAGADEPEALRHCLRRILAALDGDGGPRPTAPRAVRRAVRLLEERADEPLRLDDLAGATGWSRGHLIKEFRRALGLTPYAYLLQLRVERARARIAAGRPLAEAAHASGFADQSHMNRLFKRVLGVTPGVFARGLHSPSP